MSATTHFPSSLRLWLWYVKKNQTSRGSIEPQSEVSSQNQV